jgi:hypothetical protein
MEPEGSSPHSQGTDRNLTAALYWSEPNKKQNFTQLLFSVLSAIIKIAKYPSRHL